MMPLDTAPVRESYCFLPDTGASWRNLGSHCGKQVAGADWPAWTHQGPDILKIPEQMRGEKSPTLNRRLAAPKTTFKKTQLLEVPAQTPTELRYRKSGQREDSTSLQ